LGIRQSKEEKKKLNKVVTKLQQRAWLETYYPLLTLAIAILKLSIQNCIPYENANLNIPESDDLQRLVCKSK
jgi:hypothetical protein